MTNLQLFEYSGVHPEPIIDPYYNRDKVVIPPTVEETNDLVEKNAKLIELISVFNYFLEQGKGSSDREVADVVSKVIRILDATEGINLTPLSQFFMVYNSSYNSFKGYTTAEKQEFVYEMLKLYCKERHGMYMSHGYTNSILQVVCDNYSHKRNSKTTIVKVCDSLESLGSTPKSRSCSARIESTTSFRTRATKNYSPASSGSIPLLWSRPRMSRANSQIWSSASASIISLSK